MPVSSNTSLRAVSASSSPAHTHTHTLGDSDLGSVQSELNKRFKYSHILWKTNSHSMPVSSKTSFRAVSAKSSPAHKHTLGDNELGSVQPEEVFHAVSVSSSPAHIHTLGDNELGSVQPEEVFHAVSVSSSPAHIHTLRDNELGSVHCQLNKRCSQKNKFIRNADLSKNLSPCCGSYTLTCSHTYTGI